MLVSKTRSRAVTEDNNHDREAHYEAAAPLRERQIQSKERIRRKLAALSFTEKIKILERLRERELVLAEARQKLKESNAISFRPPPGQRES